MKSIKWAFLALSLITLTLNSCKKSGTTPTTPKVTHTLTLKYNGNDYTASTFSVGYSTMVGLQMSGIFDPNTAMTFSIYSGVKVGSFDISSGNAGTYFTAGTTAPKSYTGTTGTITITSFTSTTVAGTFQFTGTDIADGSTCTVTNGTFQTSYTTLN